MALMHVEPLVSTHTRSAMSGGGGNGAACVCDDSEWLYYVLLPALRTECTRIIGQDMCFMNENE